MKDEIKEIYLSNLEWTKTHDNIGGVMCNLIFKDNMSYEDYQKLFKTTYFILCDKDYITNLQEENQKLNKEKNVLLENLCMARQKYNNDKARYRRKAKVYKEELDKTKSRCEKAIQREMELSYLYDTQPDEELLNILQGEDKDVKDKR